jgi:hypothetical protein
MNAITLKGRFDGAIRERTVKFAKISNPSMRKAQMRIAQPKPTSGIRRTTMMGKITPPKDDPAATRPRAAPRLWKNQVDTYNVNERRK